jgi:hypothetical protein
MTAVLETEKIPTVTLAAALPEDDDRSVVIFPAGGRANTGAIAAVAAAVQATLMP